MIYIKSFLSKLLSDIKPKNTLGSNKAVFIYSEFSELKFLVKFYRFSHHLILAKWMTSSEAIIFHVLINKNCSATWYHSSPRNLGFFLQILHKINFSLALQHVRFGKFCFQGTPSHWLYLNMYSVYEAEQKTNFLMLLESLWPKSLQNLICQPHQNYGYIIQSAIIQNLAIQGNQTLYKQHCLT